MHYKALCNEMQNVSTRLHGISELWNELYKVATMYNDNDDVKKVFTLMSNYTKQWSECEQPRAEGLKVSYYKESERLGNRKEELFRKGDVVKWELKEEDKRKIYVITELGKEVLQLELKRIKRLYKTSQEVI